MRFLSLALAVFVSLGSYAHAEERCFDAEPVVDRIETWDLTTGPRSDFYLPTRNVYGIFPTKAAAHLAWEDSSALAISFDHELPPGLVGIQYTVHRLQVEMNGYVYDYDFTRGCTEPGLSFFPRETAAVPAIKLPFATGAAQVRIRIWGHL